MCCHCINAASKDTAFFWKFASNGNFEKVRAELIFVSIATSTVDLQLLLRVGPGTYSE